MKIKIEKIIKYTNIYIDFIVNALAVSIPKLITHRVISLNVRKRSISSSRGYTDDFCYDFRSDLLLLNDVKEYIT